MGFWPVSCSQWFAADQQLCSPRSRHIAGRNTRGQSASTCTQRCAAPPRRSVTSSSGCEATVRAVTSRLICRPTYRRQDCQPERRETRMRQVREGESPSKDEALTQGMKPLERREGEQRARQDSAPHGRQLVHLRRRLPMTGTDLSSDGRAKKRNSVGSARPDPAAYEQQARSESPSPLWGDRTAFSVQMETHTTR